MMLSTVRQSRCRRHGHLATSRTDWPCPTRPASDSASPHESDRWPGRRTPRNVPPPSTLGLVAAVSPKTLWRVLRESAGEAMEFTRATAVSAVGAGMLDHFEAVVTDLNRSSQLEPPGEQFVIAHAYRQRVEKLIQGRHTLKEERELYVYAAWLSELLACHAHDLGYPLAAEAYAIDCYEHADQAGHDELCAWATDATATIAMYAARPGKALMAAKKGIGKISHHHPLAVGLRAQAAPCLRPPRPAHRVHRDADRGPRTVRSAAGQTTKPIFGGYRHTCLACYYCLPCLFLHLASRLHASREACPNSAHGA